MAAQVKVRVCVGGGVWPAAA